MMNAKFLEHIDESFESWDLQQQAKIDGIAQSI